MAYRLFTLLSVLVVAGFPGYAAAAHKVGVIGSLNGKVTGVQENTTAQVPLKAGDAIYLNETVRTGPDGAAQLMFLDKSSLTLTPSSEVKIDTFVYNPATSEGSMSVRGAKGTFRFIGGALSKNAPVVIKTPVSTIGIRGGIMQASIGGGNAQAIFLYGREMTVANATGGVTSTLTQFGQGALISTGGEIQALSPSQVSAQIQNFNSSTVSSAGAEQTNAATGTSSSASSSEKKEDEASSETAASGDDSGSSEAAAIPPANSHNSSANVPSIPAVSDTAGNNWGAWAQAISDNQKLYPSTSLTTIISAVTSSPSLGSNLTAIPTNFGTIAYNGTANGSVTVSGVTTPTTGLFSANINFGTQQITNFNMSTFGVLNVNYSGSQSQISNVPVTGTLAGNAASGTLNLAVYGNAADVLGGKFSASSVTGDTAQGVLVGHQ